MKNLKLITLVMLSVCFGINAQHDWDNISVPANAGSGKVWQLQESASDDFNYTFNPTNNNANFGPPGQAAKWNNFYHNPWEGPGPTKWMRDHCAVSGGHLNIWANREGNNQKSFDFGGDSISRPETRSGCITSKTRVKYPVFVEASLRVMNSSLASDIWLLSPDDTQEIDIIECYGGGGDDGRNNFFAETIHLSHHVFNRAPFKDYQPADLNSWWKRSGVTKWGGRVVRIGVYWKNETTLEYYVDGQLVRILANNAIQTRLANGSWQYTYPTGVANGQIIREGGFQAVKTASSLSAAQSASNTSVIDPLNNLNNGKKLNKEMDIIINVEDQSWQAEARRSPNNTEIARFNDNNLLVNWIRVYKPVNSGGGTPPPTGATQFQYDVGTNTSVVWPNYTRLSNTQTPGSFGWTNTSGIGSRDRGAARGRNNINRDINFSASTRTFRQNVSNGNWNVLITFGDTYARRNMNVKAEGQNKLSNINTNVNQYLSKSFNVNVNDGKLDLEFSKGNGGDVWSITRIWIRKVGTNGAKVGNSTQFADDTEITVDDIRTSSSFAVYPNPAKADGMVTIANSVIGSSIIIYNSTGQIMKEVIAVSENQEISLTGFAKGMYFINSNDANITKLVVK